MHLAPAFREGTGEVLRRAAFKGGSFKSNRFATEVILLHPSVMRFSGRESALYKEMCFTAGESDELTLSVLTVEAKPYSQTENGKVLQIFS